MNSNATALNSLQRDQTVDALSSELFDCVVIGGGITGAGIAREASLRGWRVALLEANDFASGTSSRSSKLIHGGLRYLAMGDFSLVRSSALERKVIHRLAPHLAEPRWLVVPARSWAGLLKLRTGITTYEKLGAVEKKDLHQNWSAKDLEQNEPLFERDRYKHACVYREYLTDDARLVLANLRSARAAGATLLNHAAVIQIINENQQATGVVARCQATQHEFQVRARCVINAAGPWIESLLHTNGHKADAKLHLSKGVHIVLPHERLPIENMFILNTPDRRSIFAIPRGDCVYLGTTDTTYSRGAEIWPRITRADVDYLLEPIARYFRTGPIHREHVAAAWAGLRPLIAEPGKAPHEISRKEEVWIGPTKMVTIAGGKLTGYRPMAQLTLDKAKEVSGLPLAEEREGPQLPGGDFSGDLEQLASQLKQNWSISSPVARRLARLYGTEAASVLEAGSEKICTDSLVVDGEVSWAIQMEAALTLEDLLYRRTRAALYDLAAREKIAEPLATRMANILGWSEERRNNEVASVNQLLNDDIHFYEEE